VRKRNLLENPTRDIPSLRLPEKPILTWKNQDISQFLAYTDKKYKGTSHEFIYAYYMIAINTGMRASEILALRWSSVDFENKSIEVYESFCKVSRKLKSPKSGHKRYVPITKDLLRYLTEYKKTHGMNEFVVQTPQGTHPDENNIRNRYWLRDIRDSGVPKMIFHGVRHAFAFQWVRRGKSVYILQNILGHADNRMTQKYSRLDSESLATAMDDFSFGTKPTKKNLEIDKKFPNPFIELIDRNKQMSESKKADFKELGQWKTSYTSADLVGSVKTKSKDKQTA
jgi:integrase